MVRVVVYTRVSTDEQNPRSQLTEIKRYCEEKGYTIVRIFSDEGVSGSIDPLNRPAFREMLEFVRKNNIPVIVMYDLTRFYRAPSPLMALARYNDIMEKYHVLIEFVAEPQIQDPLLSELWRFMKSFIASYERLMISQRTKYGLKRVKEEGRLYHRPTLLHYFAYVYAGFEKPPEDREERERAVIFRQLDPETLRVAARALVALVERARRNYPWSAVPAVLASDPLIQTMYEYFPWAPRSPEAWRRAYEQAKKLLQYQRLVKATS